MASSHPDDADELPRDATERLGDGSGGTSSAPRLIIVLGMHRSGTSAMTRVINLLGAGLSDDLLTAVPASEGDPGLWESRRIVALDDEALASAGSSWGDISPLSPEWFDSKEAAKVRSRLTRELESKLAAADLFVVKDPRISRLVPLWRAVLDDLEVRARFVVMTRHPIEVAASLRARDGFATARSVLLWLRHVLEAERATRGSLRSLVHFDHLLEDWQRELRRVFRELDVDWPSITADASGRIGSFLSPDHKHHNASLEQPLDADPEVLGWARRVYRALLPSEASSPEAAQQLDAVAAELEAADLVFAPLLADQGRRISRLEREVARLPMAQQEADQRRQAILHLARVLIDLNRRLIRQQEEIAGQRETLRGIFESSSWRLTEPLRWFARRLRSADSTAPESVRAAKRLIEAAGLFETDHYANQLLETSEDDLDLLAHYLKVGAVNGLNPHPLFDSRFYLNQNEDVDRAGTNPLVHFITHGAKEGRDPHPLFATSFYLGQGPDLGEPPGNPLAHYAHFGGAETANPHPLFDGGYYLEQDPAVRRSGLNPLIHYLLQGADQGLDPHPLFQTAYYRERYPDVTASGLNPLVHFVLVGSEELRDPHPMFDTAFYLEQYPDVAAAGLVPVFHYVASGATEGRISHPSRRQGTSPLPSETRR